MMSSKHPLRLLSIVLALSLMPVASSAANTDDYELISCEMKPCPRSSRGAHSHPRIDAYPRIDADFRDTKSISTESTNWAGYVAAVGDLNNPTPHTVTKVSGSWIVPNLQASPAGNTSASIWVGIDGSKSPSVEQLGTEHDVKDGLQSHYAWFEMFPQPSSMMTGFPVEIGDHITASVTYVALPGVLPQGNTLFIMQMTNDTKKVYTVIPSLATTDMQRLCAEWIVEAPYLNGTLPLSNFGIAYLSNCVTKINNVTGAINNPFWLNESMNMISVNGGTPKATTSALSPDGKSFSVAWKGN